MNPNIHLPQFSQATITEWHQYLAEGFDDGQQHILYETLTLAATNESANGASIRGLEVAVILKQLSADADMVVAAILSDRNVANNIDRTNIKDRFGENISILVEHILDLKNFNDYSKDNVDLPGQAEILRRMLLAMVKDVRALIIKLAWRVQRMRTMSSEMDGQKQLLAKETLNIYAPLANRIGIAQLKWELEDLSLRCLQPQIYRQIAKSLAENRSNRENYLKFFTEQLRRVLAEEKLEAEVYGRPKHIYSIWRKMQQKQLDFTELFDIRAVRIVTSKVSDCYEILGLVHTLWSYLPDEFDDYIANPKANGYQSLHTIVVGPDQKLVEIQIRTREMHDFAELGVAAHWLYKEGGKHDAAAERNIVLIRSLLESKGDDQRLLNSFQTELYSERIFVITPKGQIKDLVKGATPLDFAYAIHTEVGHRCRGAKVDGRIVPLSYQLKSGQRVEILTAKHGGPNRSWLDANLGYLKSSHAINKVKAWFKQQNHETNIQDGKTILEKIRQRLGLGDIDLNKLTRRFHLNRPEDFLIQIGRGDISQTQLAGALEIPEQIDYQRVIKSRPIQKFADTDHIIVHGVGNIKTQIASCCRPVPGDPVVGYITRGKGVTVHRQDCKNLLNHSEESQERLIDVSWGKETFSFPVKIFVEAYDRSGLLSDVTRILSIVEANIVNMQASSEPKNLTVTIDLTIAVKNTTHLAEILGKLNQLQNVIEARRKN